MFAANARGTQVGICDGHGNSLAIYLENVKRVDVVTFIAYHLNAFEYLGGILQALPIRQRRGGAATPPGPDNLAA